MFKRLRDWYDYLGYRTFSFTVSAYITAASLIGFETAAVILGYITVWPIGAPLMLIGIALWVIIRRRIMRRKHDDEDAPGD